MGMLTTRTAALAAEMRADVDGNGRKGKLYKAEVDGGTEAQQYNHRFIKTTVGSVAHNLINDVRERVDLRDTAEVQARVMEYVEACEAAGLIPGMSGLCGYSLHCSRQWVQKFKRDNPGHATTRFLDRVGELFADCLSNAALAGASNAVMSLFVLKNNHGYSDRVELEAVQSEAEEPERKLTADEIARKYGVGD